jgi:hypothetical protein
LCCRWQLLWNAGRNCSSRSLSLLCSTIMRHSSCSSPTVPATAVTAARSLASSTTDKLVALPAMQLGTTQQQAQLLHLSAAPLAKALGSPHLQAPQTS